MSLFTDASLVYVPSGVKDGKTYSIVPTDGSGDLTFSRGSDIEATRVNANGYIEKAQVNLLLQSNQFDTTWTNSNTTDTGGQADKDGGTDAWKITAVGTGSARKMAQNIVTSGVISFSVYAKAGTAPVMGIEVAGTGGFYNYFNLSTGAIGSGVGSISKTITAVGNGYYRCTITGNASAVSSVNIFVCDADGSTAVTDGAYLYIQDAQLNYGLVAQTYQETTTAAVVSGITDNMPRLNYDPANPTCPSLILEPSRTNLLPQSEYFGGSDWLKANATIEDNVVISPEGVQNASRIIETAVNASHQIYDGFSATSGQAYTISFFAKENGRDIGVGMASGIFGSNSTHFDLTNGVVLSTTSESASIEDYGDGWYRCSVTNTADSSGTALVYIILSNNENFNYLGDGTSGAYIYGAQVEAGYPTSYIPTYGTSATRGGDLALKTSASALIGQTEGTIFFEIDDADFDATNGAQLFSLDNGTSLDRIEIYAAGAGAAAGKIGVYVQRGSAQVAQTTSVNVQGHHKVALAYKLNDYALYIDGVLQHSDTSALVPACSAVRLQGRYDNLMTGKHSNKQALLFKTRLPNSDLATLTA